MAKKAKEPAKSEPSFEEAIDLLEQITRQLESGALTLDESIRAYEQGMELKKTCQKMLENARKKLEYLERKEDGSLERKDIEMDEDEEIESAGQSRLFQDT
ncbi:MAG: exodeoxyribonuclease VII small subunit [Leptospiraceae bacterium]|nr:exodeoxyribonuclease VII small subunit [Leptospiraceae bacterium]MCB1319601.1 exodeoxyribonuclease VII small subunit [Leptospiraceae bacterium]